MGAASSSAASSLAASEQAELVERVTKQRERAAAQSKPADGSASVGDAYLQKVERLLDSSEGYQRFGWPGRSPPPRGLGDLPDDLVLNIFAHLDPESRVRARAVSRAWRALVPMDCPALRLERMLHRYTWRRALDAAILAGGPRDVDTLLRAAEADPELFATSRSRWSLLAFVERRRTSLAVDYHDLFTAFYHSRVKTPAGLAVVDRLLQVPGLDVAAKDNHAIVWASEKGHLGVVKRLLQAPGVDATARNNLPIRVAAANGHLAVVECLLQATGVDVTARNNEAVRAAAVFGHHLVVERLLQVVGVDAAAQNNYAIRLASSRGHLSVVKCLLQAPGVDASACDNDAIRTAAERGHFAVVRRLWQEPGVRLPWRVFRDWSVFMYVCMYGVYLVIEEVLRICKVSGRV